MRNITIRQLRAIRQIATTGRINEAAQALGLTGPAVTTQLKQLEEEAGAILFDRLKTGLRPTAAGLEVLQTAETIERALNDCRQRLDALDGLERGSVDVAVVSTGKYYAPRLVASFRKAFPDIQVNLMIGNRSEVRHDLQTFVTDLAIMGRPPRDVPVDATVFGDHPIVLVAAPDHPLVGKHEVTPADLDGETMLLRETGSGTRSSTEIFLSGLSQHPTLAFVEMGSNESIKQAVMAGLGIAILSAHTIGHETETGRIAIVNMQGLPIHRQWFVVNHIDKSFSPAARAFRDYIVAHGRAHLPQSLCL